MHSHRNASLDELCSALNTDNDDHRRPLNPFQRNTEGTCIMSSNFLRKFSRNALAGVRFMSTSRPPKGHWRPLSAFTAVAVSSLAAGTLGAIYPPPPISILFPRAAPGPPADPSSPESIAYSDSLEERMQALPLLKQLRESEDAKEWYETRPYQGFPEERRVNNLTAGALRGPGKLAQPPLIRAK